MALIEWDNKFSVGVTEIDDQHKNLFKMINSLHEAMKSGKAKEVLTTILDEVTDYTIKHFSYEEKLMLQYQYPEYKSHKAVHDDFIKKVVDFKQQHQQQLLTAGQLLRVLQTWLLDHINNIDKQYSAILTKSMNK